MHILDIVLGRTLANREHKQHKIGWFKAVPAMGLDGLGPASYGPEAALTVLIHGGGELEMDRCGHSADRLLDTPGGSVAVLISEIVLAHWWERFLHPRRGERLRGALHDLWGRETQCPHCALAAHIRIHVRYLPCDGTREEALRPGRDGVPSPGAL